MPLPENDEMFNTKGKMLQDITTLLGGRVAEELILMILQQVLPGYQACNGCQSYGHQVWYVG